MAFPLTHYQIGMFDDTFCAQIIEIAETLQRASSPLSLREMGYKPVSFNWLPKQPRGKPGNSKPLTPVIPSSNFLRTLSAKNITNEQEIEEVQRPKSANAASCSKLRRSKGLPPRLASPLKCVQVYDENQREMKEEMGARIIHNKKVAVPNLKLVDAKGEPYNYDYHGRKVSPEHVKKYEKVIIEPPPIILPKSNTVFNGEIIKKTMSFIESKKEKEAKEKVVVFPWKPRILPGSTYSNDINNDVLLPNTAFINCWPEYAHLEENDVMVTIEYCNQCNCHSDTLRHNEKQYENLAKKFKSAFCELFNEYTIRYGVEFHTFSDWADSSGIPGKPREYGKYTKPTGHVFHVDVSQRVGAFEIQVMNIEIQAIVYIEMFHAV